MICSEIQGAEEIHSERGDYKTPMKCNPIKGSKTYC